MQYTFNCPAPECGHEIKVHAQTKKEAFDKIMAAGAEHAKTVHPGMPMDQKAMEQMVGEALDRQKA